MLVTIYWRDVLCDAINLLGRRFPQHRVTEFEEEMWPEDAATLERPGGCLRGTDFDIRWVFRLEKREQALPGPGRIEVSLCPFGDIIFPGQEHTPVVDLGPVPRQPLTIPITGPSGDTEEP
jgi:hypothetical protein